MSLSGLARGAAVNLVARVATVALGLAILVVVARLGPQAQGAFSLFVAIEGMLLALFSGFGLALARQVSHHGDDGARPLRRWLRAALVAGLLAAGVLAAVSALAGRTPYDRLWLLGLAAPLLLLVPTASGLWLGRGQMVPLNLPQVAAPALVLAGLAVAWGWAQGTAAGPASPVDGAGPVAGEHLAIALMVPVVLVVWVAAKALVGLVTAWAALRQAPLAGSPAPAAIASEPGWRFVVVIGATNLVSLLNYRLTLFLVERHEGLAAAGVYSVAVQLAELLWMLSTALSVSATRRIGEPDAAVAARTTLSAARWAVFMTLAAAPLLAVSAWWALPWVLGDAYAAARAPLVLLLPGVAAYAAASALSAYFTHHLGRPHWAGGVAALSLALNAAGCSWAVPAHGMAGAAVSTSVSYALAIMVALALFVRRSGLGWRAVWRGAEPRQ